GWEKGTSSACDRADLFRGAARTAAKATVLPFTTCYLSQLYHGWDEPGQGQNDHKSQGNGKFFPGADSMRPFDPAPLSAVAPRGHGWQCSCVCSSWTPAMAPSGARDRQVDAASLGLRPAHAQAGFLDPDRQADRCWPRGRGRVTVEVSAALATPCTITEPKPRIDVPPDVRGCVRVRKGRSP